MSELREHSDPDIVVMLVGNKVDLKHLRAVNTEDAREFAGQHNLLFVETSALESTNVEEAFTETIRKVHSIQLEKIKSQVPTSRSGLIAEEKITLEEKNNEEKKCCWGWFGG